ncbi:hypothetical protein EGW08_013074, partial [Elysia chlorotica]
RDGTGYNERSPTSCSKQSSECNTRDADHDNERCLFSKHKALDTNADRQSQRSRIESEANLLCSNQRDVKGERRSYNRRQALGAEREADGRAGRALTDVTSRAGAEGWAGSLLNQRKRASGKEGSNSGRSNPQPRESSKGVRSASPDKRVRGSRVEDKGEGRVTARPIKPAVTARRLRQCGSMSSISCYSSDGDRHLMGNRSDAALEGKMSDAALEGKMSDATLMGKRSDVTLGGKRSDATLVGKRDSWIWFSHEHRPSMENFASRQRRFHSRDPRVARLADE